MIVVENISAGFSSIPVLQDVSLTVPAGKIVVAIGANGAGKTTLLRTISNIIKPTAGRVLFDGKANGTKEPHLLARGGLVHVPQGRQIVPSLTVRQNLVVAAESAGYRDKVDLASQLDLEFNRFPVLGQRMSIPGGNLSGGEQQMLAVSRALMMKPKAIMLDEPSLGLAPKAVALILKALRSLANDGLSVLLVEQLAMLALEVADNAYVLQRGKIVTSGLAADLKGDPTLIESYLS